MTKAYKRVKMNYRFRCGRVAQLGEHLLCKQGVTGSIPVTSTNFLQNRKPWLAVSCLSCSADMPAGEWEIIQTADPLAIRLGERFRSTLPHCSAVGTGANGPHVYKATTKIS